jgi:SecD/SecF fusion protein
MEESLRNVQRRNTLILNELLRESQASLQLGLDLRGGVAFTLALDERPANGERPRDDLSAFERERMLEKAIEIIRQRADGLGVAEPVIRPVGENRIEVQLPGVTTRDNPDITDALRRPARLEFRLVHPMVTPGPDPDDLPPGFEILIQQEENPQTGDIIERPYVVNRIPVLLGDEVARARPVTDEFGRFSVELAFTSRGGDRFAQITREMAQRWRQSNETQLQLLAIVLDGTLYSAPRVTNEIPGGRASITGRFSQREAVELSNVLNNPLDVPLEIVEMYEVGPTLAEDSVTAARTAMIIGATLVAIFMLAYYLMAGVVACVTLTVNVIIILGVLASIGATLTLPGIAGIILTIGMAVDANILIFERIREELSLGKTLKTSLIGGYEKALSTIVDANVTTLLTASILIYFGTGPVKGFGITLAIGIFTSMFGALIISRLLLEALILPGYVTKLPMASIWKESNIDFLKYRKPAFIASWAIVFIGLVTVFTRGDKIYGIDFVGGDEIRIAFSDRLSTSDIERVAAERELGEVIPVYRSPIGGTMEELSIQTEANQGEAVFAALQAEFPQANLRVIGENRIGPAVGREIRTNAMWAIGIALLGILLYVAFRFEMGYGIGAVVAVVHDLLMTIGIFVLAGKQFTAPMVAGVLMVVGYSINDTIVVFDRIREQLQLDPNSKLRDVINYSINRVLARTIVTSLTTLLATGALWVFGGGVVNDFAFIFIIGILTGTFSSIFIASPIFFWWHKGDRRHVEERHDVLPNYEWVASSKASK